MSNLGSLLFAIDSDIRNCRKGGAEKVVPKSTETTTRLDDTTVFKSSRIAFGISSANGTGISNELCWYSDISDFQFIDWMGML